MLEKAKKLENDFTTIAGDEALSVLAKRLALSRLIRQMVDEAIEDYKSGCRYSDLRADFVMDFFERDDLAPQLLSEAFAVTCAVPDAENSNYVQLMHIARSKKDQLVPYMPNIVFVLDKG